MPHDVRLWIVPLVALILGLVIFYGSKDKNVTLGGYIFLAAFAILLWLLATGGVRL